MLKLRQEHMNAFETMYAENFEDRMTQDIACRFYDDFEKIGEEGVRKRIRSAIERSESYDMETQAELAAFIRLTFGLCPDFDTSRKYPYARGILEDKSRPMMERLTDIRRRARQATRAGAMGK